MPIYEYRCQGCGHQLEALQKIDEGLLRKCPECGTLKLKRLVSAPSFRLKGSGWYETDFKGGKKKLADAGDGKTGDKDDQKDGQKEGAKEDKKSGEKDGKESSGQKDAAATSSAAGSRGGKSTSDRPGSKAAGRPEQKSGSGKTSATPD